ncbi:mannitol dehydrogenase family protein [Inquilinus limosus]|uniref:Mannitol dehydrogenase n=1 Tax=Inquilinus limosus TaxID=171674 RepID=A0A211ZH14_9PROT|nr:mannitol dehydrogenase family protein [Inquilinus limosus]OWJ64572.1 mannitol dehydrogenase [Inquilinus limosus]
MTMSLTLANLDALSARVAVPSYCREDLSAGIVHFGIGNFHRAHQAVYLDALLNLGGDRDWGLIGAGVTAYDGAMRDRLKGQDWLTTVVEQDIGRSAARVTGAMIGFLDPQDRASIVATLADPAIRVVSLTITEGGYFLHPASGAFDPEHPAIVADGCSPDDPRTVFGFIVAGLKRRRAAGLVPFTVLSCDNIPGNGHVTQAAVAGLARLSDPELADWVAADVAFPNSMVDRITPATGPREIEHCRATFGIADASPVYCEEFRQWVLEDHFTAGRPALEKVGVTFVPDVAPYELMKIRILNGGHAAIAYPGELLDIPFVHEAMEDPEIGPFLARLEREEIIPSVPPVPDTDLDAYFSLVQRRFLNPKVADTIPRLARDGSDRQPKFIIPVIADRLRAGGSIAGLALVSALWCRHCFGTTDSGRQVPPNDTAWDALQARAGAAKDDPLAWISMADIYGDLATSERFAKAFADSLGSLWDIGTRATLARYVSGEA